MRTAILVALLLSMAGCAGPSVSNSAPVPSATPSGPSQAPTSQSPQPPGEPNPLDPALAFLRYSCGGHPFGLDLLAAPGQAELENHPSAEALRQFLAGGAASDLVPIGGWHLAGRDTLRASYVAQVAGDPPFASIDLSFRDGSWHVDGYGQCRPMFEREGLNPATFQFVDGPPEPDATRMELDVTEVACASGRPMGARLQRPTVVENDSFVYLLFVAKSQDGGQDCPSNPATRVTVELRAPVGARTVLDVAVFPFHDPSTPWPN